MKKNDSNCWPTEAQFLLLQSALLESEKAAIAWKEYCAFSDLTKVSYVETTFFPLVFQNVGKPSFELLASHEMQVCKSVYRHSWAANHLRLNKIFKVIQLLQEAGFSICLLKGAAMITAYYKNPGLRIIGDVDILIPRDQIKEAVALLLKLGWSLISNKKTLDVLLNMIHAVTLTNAAGDQIDLHWTIFSESIFDEKLRHLIVSSEEIKSSGMPCTVFVLSPEDHLIHTLYHGLKYSEVPLIRWIADAVTIIKNTPYFNWVYFLAQASTAGITFVMQQGIVYLEGQSFIAVPEFVSHYFLTYCPSEDEIKYFKVFAKPLTGLKEFIIYCWYMHKKKSDSKNRFILLMTLPQSLKQQRNIGWCKLFFLVVKKSILPAIPGE
ncbi:MAG: nucleotidyltransferase family protein [Coxiellaceae bacterium]|nr:nucleotidyltransferase family protein [Coxiellaceae bacterium]